jgi:hypothetical protein
MRTAIDEGGCAGAWANFSGLVDEVIGFRLFFTQVKESKTAFIAKEESTSKHPAKTTEGKGKRKSLEKRTLARDPAGGGRAQQNESQPPQADVSHPQPAPTKAMKHHSA